MGVLHIQNQNYCKVVISSAMCKNQFQKTCQNAFRAKALRFQWLHALSQHKDYMSYSSALSITQLLLMWYTDMLYSIVCFKFPFPLYWKYLVLYDHPSIVPKWYLTILCKLILVHSIEDKYGCNILCSKKHSQKFKKKVSQSAANVEYQW